jgi:heme/copper-type cytochrome/quinol oxidase subunit 2
MKSTKLAILYWVITSLIVFILGIAGVVCLFRMDGVPKVIGGLGYPTYVLTFLGLTDLMGVAAIVLPVPRTLCEWA